MKFRAVRASAIGNVDAIVIPVFAEGPLPAWLPRATRNALARIQKTEHGTSSVTQARLADAAKEEAA